MMFGLIELPIWIVIAGGICTILFGGGGIVYAALQIYKAPSEIHKTNADINQIVVSGSIEITSKLMTQISEALDIANKERKEKEDCYERMETIKNTVKLPDKSSN